MLNKSSRIFVSPSSRRKNAIGKTFCSRGQLCILIGLVVSSCRLMWFDFKRQPFSTALLYVLVITLEFSNSLRCRLECIFGDFNPLHVPKSQTCQSHLTHSFIPVTSIFTRTVQCFSLVVSFNKLYSKTVFLVVFFCPTYWTSSKKTHGTLGM